ncbi:MAG: hypothetical protein IJ870_05510 [Alphaproteobacteria bacterium]|nr:hypothetical protein [Alphaproteobacteria bacterium]
MVEMLGVLAIIGVLSAGALAGYSKAMEKHKTNKLQDEIQMIATNIITSFQGQYDYSALGTSKTGGTTMAIRLNAIPAEMVQDGQAIHPFKGNVYVYAVDYANTTNGAFKIDIEGLPQKVAVALGMDGNNLENATLMNIELSSENTND